MQALKELRRCGFSKGGFPHIHYHDVYPGLQAYIHAGFFLVFGASIWTLQLSWLLVAGSTAVFTYLLVRELTGAPVVAALTGGGSVALAGVVYPVAMPTWWNVMLSAAALYLLLKGHRSGRVMPIGLAGLLVGVSTLIKPTGFLIAVPAFIWLISRRAERRRGVLEGAIVLGIGAIATLASRSLSGPRIVLIWGPALAGLATIYLARTPRVENAKGRDHVSFALTFAVGALLPPTLTAAGYAAVGEFGALLDGWVVGPSLRFTNGVRDIPCNWGP